MTEKQIGLEMLYVIGVLSGLSCNIQEPDTFKRVDRFLKDCEYITRKMLDKENDDLKEGMVDDEK